MESAWLRGAALSALLLREREIGPLGFVFVSYALGYALNIIEYFAVAAIGALRAAGVSYVIRTKSLAPDYEGPGTEKVFETDTVDVWKIVD